MISEVFTADTNNKAQRFQILCAFFIRSYTLQAKHQKGPLN